MVYTCTCTAVPNRIFNNGVPITLNNLIITCTNLFCNTGGYYEIIKCNQLKAKGRFQQGKLNSK